MSSAEEGPSGISVLQGGVDLSEGTGRLLESAVTWTLRSEGVTAAELSLTCLDDDDMRALNREHLSHDRTTDVIAFALFKEGETVVGDVYIGLDQARRQAVGEVIPLDDELTRLAIHGTLHVLGWTHTEAESRPEAGPMYRRQEDLVAQVMKRRP